MKRIFTITIFTILFATLALAQKGGDVKQQLIKLDKEWAAATAKGDVKALDRILADDYIYTDLDGSIGTKAELLKDLKANSKMSHPPLETDDYSIRVYGTTAIMTHLAMSSHEGNTKLRSLHVWVKHGQTWRVVAHQWTTVMEAKPDDLRFRAKCANYSYQPEVIAYFGDSTTITQKLDNDQMGLPDRRGYLLLIETKDSAEFSFFERADDQHFRVSQWKGASLGDLREKLTDVILENRGIACVGAQTKSIVNTRFNPSDLGTIPMPLSARAAFSHMLKKYGDQYLRVTVLLLC